MGSPRPFSRVKLFCGLIMADPAAASHAVKRMADAWSPVDLESPHFPFDRTDYYRAEMGGGLVRRFVAFRELVDPGVLPDIKLLCLDLEAELSLDGRRRVNLDPGYISTARVVIATTKDHCHRIPLRNGIYAHLEYVVAHGGLRTLDWTYPDFQTPEITGFFNDLRHHLRRQLRGSSAAGPD